MPGIVPSGARCCPATVEQGGKGNRKTRKTTWKQTEHLVMCIRQSCFPAMVELLEPPFGQPLALLQPCNPRFVPNCPIASLKHLASGGQGLALALWCSLTARAKSTAYRPKQGSGPSVAPCRNPFQHHPRRSTALSWPKLHPTLKLSRSYTNLAPSGQSSLLEPE